MTEKLEGALVMLAQMKQERDRFKQQNREVFEEASRLDALVKELDELVRHETLKAYRDTNNKTPHPAAYIKMRTIENYRLPDNISAAVDKAPSILEVDPDQFALCAREASQALSKAGLLQVLTINNAEAKKMKAEWLIADVSYIPTVNIRSDLSDLLKGSDQ